MQLNRVRYNCSTKTFSESLLPIAHSAWAKISKPFIKGCCEVCQDLAGV